MTNEKAIKHLEVIKGDCALVGDIRALDMAISALSEELSEDGTLTVHVSDGSKVKRVFVMGDNIFGGLYYPDSENKGHWKVGFGNTWCSCSECSGNGSTNWSYCPWCGADMRGEIK